MSDDLTPRLEDEFRRLPARAALVYQPLDGRPDWRLHPGEPFPAASVVKVPILMEVLRQAQEGLLDLAERLPVREADRVGGAGVLTELHEGVEVTLRDLARLMIVVSDNTASNLLLDRVGFPAVRSLMASLGMADTRLGRKFMHPAGDDGDNVTTAADMARCLEALWRGEVLRGEWREEALATMRRQQFREKIPAMLPPSSRVAHKTGELDGVRHDVGILEDSGRAWVLVALTREGRDPWDVDYRIARISSFCRRDAMEEDGHDG